MATTHFHGKRLSALAIALGVAWGSTAEPAAAQERPYARQTVRPAASQSHVTTSARRGSRIELSLEDDEESVGPRRVRQISSAATTSAQGRGAGCRTDGSPWSSPSMNPYATPESTLDSPDFNRPGSDMPSSDLSAFNAPEGGAIGNPNLVAAASPGGYLDVAAPVTMFRMRYDDALNSNQPDRGEFFYAKCGCFRQLGADPNAKGPPGIHDSVNYQALRTHIEYAPSTRFSIFTELPVQWVHFHERPAGPANPIPGTSPDRTSGFADMNVGFKFAFIACPDEYLTFQLRTYLPTGDAGEGLGTGHVAIESGLLYYRRFTERWIVQGEFKETAPIDVGAYASNVLEYGAGLGYIAVRSECFSITPMLEMVGWTFLGGQTLTPSGPVSASGDTIINFKPGVRIGLSDLYAPAGQQRHSVYMGWGHPLTGDRLYKDIYRLEYRYMY